MNNTGIIILASCATSHPGVPKHLLKTKGESLLRKNVKTAMSVSTATITVLGNHYFEHLKEIKHLKTMVAFNLNWNKGMSNCARFGLHKLNKNYPGLASVIIMACDEPLMDQKTLNNLIIAHQKGHCIVASIYMNKLGLPVILDRKLFKEILKMDDETGFKNLVERYGVCKINFPSKKKKIMHTENWKML